MKRVLGLDLGTNSIGWALVESDFEKKEGKIVGLGTRVIPMSQDILGDFGKGNSVSQTAERTKFRSVRRLRERHLLRRQRLHRVLNVLGFLPEHFQREIDFEKRLGQFKGENEPKLAYREKQFIFMDSFYEMLQEFAESQPDLISDNKKIPYDWTIYYLRKKALSEKITKAELAWLILNFNQKRGYYQLRGEDDEENSNRKVEFHSLRVEKVLVDEEQKSKTDLWYSIVLENGWIYRRQSKTPLYDWIDKVKDFIVTTDLNEDGSEKTDKEGNVKRSFRAPSEDDWNLKKKKTEAEIESSSKTVGEFIYTSLLSNPSIKIKGKLIKTIERKYYKDELRKILTTQVRFHEELRNAELYNECVRELYRNNESHQIQLSKNDFIHLFLNDIIFYQRPLRSQKSLISNCTLEKRKFKDVVGIEKEQYLKVVPKSNPYYQEFRIWQWIKNLVIYKKDSEEDVTNDFLPDVNHYELLFEFLNNRKEIKQDVLFSFLLELKGIKGKASKIEREKYRWNYVEDKEYPCNETRSLILGRLGKVSNVPENFLSKEVEYNLWHIIYSVNDKVEFEKALNSFAIKNQLDQESFLNAFKKCPPFKSDYGSFSEKAIKKLLNLLRLGKYWNWESIDETTKARIGKLITGEFDEEIKERVRKAAIHLSTEIDFQGLPLWLAQYVVYDRHSEAENAVKWNSPDELEKFLQDFRQHSLRNPIVEQVVLETLRVVKDIWVHYGQSKADFFNEIHIELGREMKKTAAERERMTKSITENENTNLRIKLLLAEMANDGTFDNVRPYSPMQQEILKIYEEGALNSQNEIEDDILKISKTAQPSSADLKRYKLWLEQKYRSPYTGAVIPLNKLFTPEYEIEHVIPQSRYFDDSMSNKVICETNVNKLKDNQLGYEFIKNHGGQIVELGFGKQAKIFIDEEYEAFVKQNYATNRTKKTKLLLEEIPETMIQRQLNDTRYISKFISGILSNIVRTEENDDGINSKNLLPGNGKITTELKQDWGLNDVWNDLILPRFERLNKLTNRTDFTVWNDKHQKFLPTVPLELSKGFSKKRIDHRHHAMDALVIALATRDHINFLNNKAANSNERYDLSRKLRKYEKVKYTDSKTGQSVEREVPKHFLKPWPTFTTDAKAALEAVIVSFKQNLRIINKAVNKYEKWVIKNGDKVKEKVAQEGINWAIRKSMHKDTVSGKVHLPRIKEQKGKILTATRKTLDTSFDYKTIESITDTGIQKILRNYLKAKGDNPETAFSPEGIEDMNKNIRQYNDGKEHKPIFKVRVFEAGSKFSLGTNGNKGAKYVEAAKGTNLFFAIYADEQGKRSYETIPLNVVIERLKQGFMPVPEVSVKGNNLLFYLSPNDLVSFDDNDTGNIYRIISFTGNRLYALPANVTKSIVDKVEYTLLNKVEFAIENGNSIKEHCTPYFVSRI